jgi:hypothetical protein
VDIRDAQQCEKAIDEAGWDAQPEDWRAFMARIDGLHAPYAGRALQALAKYLDPGEPRNAWGVKGRRIFPSRR